MADFLVQQLPLLFLLILGIIIAAEHHPDFDECPITKCSDDGPLIQFPFCQKNYPLHCGHPDFEVFCLNNITMIQLSSSSGIFPIRTVDFEEQNFEVYDQDGCLPRRLLNLNISSTSLFQPQKNYSDPCQRYSKSTFTLLNCSTEQNLSTSTDGQKSYYPIKCLSVPGHHQVLAAPESTSMADLPVTTCSTSLTGFYLPLRSVDGSSDHCESDSSLFLAWYAHYFPACQNCSEQCDFNYASNQIECSPYYQNPKVCRLATMHDHSVLLG
ncbi:hypothetical protein M0R45_027974 [Rubus argutus]|uniref:RING-type E3 ubiquitin transferase n=1 Tax=Rubus argutus TaxID=59490 RepID=A0AAW1W7D4_RUBAR